jgi:hypothetical protein
MAYTKLQRPIAKTTETLKCTIVAEEEGIVTVIVNTGARESAIN